MHPTMSKHLHSEECNLLVIEYDKCNREVISKKVLKYYNCQKFKYLFFYFLRINSVVLWVFVLISKTK